MIVGSILSLLERRKANAGPRARPARVVPTPASGRALDASRLASYPTTFPAGWMPLLPEEAVGTDPIAIDVAGRSLVVFRAGSGAISVADAFCPHLGAHLALGRVCGESLECRFHGWRFATDGTVAEVPYGRRSAARLAVYPSDRFYGMVCAYVGHGEPTAEPPYRLGRVTEIDDGRFTFRGAYDAGEVRMHLGEFAENSADLQHFEHLHDRFRVPWTQIPIPFVGLRHRASWELDPVDPHVCWFENEAMVTFRGQLVEGRGGKARVRFDGPGTVIRFELDLNGRGKVVLYQFHTPMEPLTQRVRFRWFAEERVPDAFARFVVGHWISQWEQDLEIWETKSYRSRPALVPEDGPVVALRRWYQQFYEPMPSAE